MVCVCKATYLKTLLSDVDLRVLSLSALSASSSLHIPEPVPLKYLPSEHRRRLERRREGGAGETRQEDSFSLKELEEKITAQKENNKVQKESFAEHGRRESESFTEEIRREFNREGRELPVLI